MTSLGALRVSHRYFQKIIGVEAQKRTVGVGVKKVISFILSPSISPPQKEEKTEENM
jgi:hypothetical protein